jgi:hypothetical protein
VGVRLNAVTPVLGHKRPNPWEVVTIKHGVLGTTHDQTIELYMLFVADIVAAIAKLREREIQ